MYAWDGNNTAISQIAYSIWDVPAVRLSSEGWRSQREHASALQSEDGVKLLKLQLNSVV
jgi:hypothetical protein